MKVYHNTNALRHLMKLKYEAKMRMSTAYQWSYRCKRTPELSLAYREQANRCEGVMIATESILYGGWISAYDRESTSPRDPNEHELDAIALTLPPSVRVEQQREEVLLEDGDWNDDDEQEDWDRSDYAFY